MKPIRLLTSKKSDLTIDFEPSQHAPRMTWTIPVATPPNSKDAYAIYSFDGHQVRSANACYEIVASIIEKPVAEIDQHLREHYHPLKRMRPNYMRPHDLFFEQAANHVLARFADIRTIQIPICENCGHIAEEHGQPKIIHIEVDLNYPHCALCNQYPDEPVYQLFAFVQANARPTVENGKGIGSIHKYPSVDPYDTEIFDRQAHLITKQKEIAAYA